MKLAQYLGRWVLSSRTGKIGKVVGTSTKWDHIEVKFETLTKTRFYSGHTIKESLILLTAEGRADYYLKLENAGISQSWKED